MEVLVATRTQEKQDRSGSRLLTHPFNKLKIHTMMEQITTEEKMGFIPKLVKSSFPHVRNINLHGHLAILGVIVGASSRVGRMI